ncbi:MAG: hypothetical protein LBR55_06615 [Bacteroidales bacterium]|jgi:hypothetical protein|nr:hypothetical protein [Bacteroidales bacterium]
MSNNKQIRVFIFLLILSVGCSANKSYEMSVENPTEYIFPVNIDSMKTIIKQIYGLNLSYKGHYELHYSRIFEISENYNDFVLKPGYYRRPKSKVYFNKKNVPHDYFGEYHLHLTNVEKNKTKVEIITLRSGIPYKRLIPDFPHFSRGGFKELPPTTVEEYEILQMIGKALGIEKDMSPIKIPEKIIINKMIDD